ncbi:MAG TPA: DNA mismatch repair protein MutS, partial [bacterium]|nr:DNA mismatch repair protein MutS [bacterium]
MSDDFSPLMLQYQRLKATCPDVILMMRVGDFYEMFNEDADVASRILDITLTKKSIGKGKTCPLAGIPYHALHNYIYKLTRSGYRVAICEQTEDPRKTKKLVRREITRTVTPGTIIDSEVIDGTSNNYLAAIEDGGFYGLGLAFADVSTGEFRYTVLDGSDAFSQLESELLKLSPSEVLLSQDIAADSSLRTLLQEHSNAVVTHRSPEAFDPSYLKELEIQISQGTVAENEAVGLKAAGAVYQFVLETQRSTAPHIVRLEGYHPSSFMLLEANTERNLELLVNIRDKGKAGTLLSVLDDTVTAVGSRLLKRWIVRPLLLPNIIKVRQDGVELLFRNGFLRQDLRAALKNVPDLERLTSRVGFGNANARDLLALVNAAGAVCEINRLLQSHSDLWPTWPSRWEVPLKGDQGTSAPTLLDELPELVALLAPVLSENPPLSIKDGGIFREGVNAELDELREIRRGGKDWIARLRDSERQRTGINSLKIGYTKVFGYYIEVTKPNLSLVPEDYERKQTVVNGERFVTRELKEYEAKVLGAEERIHDLEYELFMELLEKVKPFTERLLRVAGSIAELDVLRSLAEVAVQNDYVRPEVDQKAEITLKECRHPVLEQSPVVPMFVPNDCSLDDEKEQLIILTGPNMAGKSTFIRQVALNVLMAQMGSFVAAKWAKVGIVDRLFTRVGASDNLSAGQSTFMVEMSETADILRKATPRSLIILDEIG